MGDGDFNRIEWMKRRRPAIPPVLLDIVEDGIPIVDDGLFHELRTQLQSRLIEAEARRVFLSPDEWYWDLAPNLKAGEVYAI